jgi:protein-tyrosine-phosphatase
MAELPGSVLFACTMNAVRSPMAEALLKAMHGKRIYVDSVGVREGELDPLAVAVLDEIGVDASRHRPKTFDQLDDSYFDLVISLSPEAQHKAVELTRDHATDLLFWHLPDPTLVEGNRDQRLDAYRLVRDELRRRLREQFPPVGFGSL